MKNSDMNSRPGVVVAVCRSGGGIPKLPLATARVTTSGVEGDAHDHDKHNIPARALSLFDEEILLEMCERGYKLVPGAIGENITLQNVNVQQMPPGTILRLGDVKIRLEGPRKPCYVLDVLGERLKDELVGCCGVMASVLEEGDLAPGMAVERAGESPVGT